MLHSVIMTVVILQSIFIYNDFHTPRQATVRHCDGSVDWLVHGSALAEVRERNACWDGKRSPSDGPDGQPCLGRTNGGQPRRGLTH